MQNLDVSLLTLFSGGVVMITIYHSVVFTYVRNRTLGQYVLYLWLVSLYILFRMGLLYLEKNHFLWHQNFDEILQMLAFMQYVRFLGFALEVKKETHRKEFNYVNTIVPVMLAHIGLNTLFFYWHDAGYTGYHVTKILIRVYLLFGGLIILLNVLRKRKTVFGRLLGAGTISLIFFGLLSTTAMFLPSRQIVFTPLVLLVLGFFVDIIFFSSAVGYRIQEEFNAKIDALQKLFIREKELSEERIKSVEVVYKTREEERQRIANDLHDDLGGTISSMLIYGNLARQSASPENTQSISFIDKLVEQSQHAMDELGELIWSTKYDAEAGSIESRIKNYGAQLLNDMHIPVDYSIDNHVDSALTSALHRKNVMLFIKEGINNIVKHSAASAVNLRIQVKEDRVEITLSDNGKGFDQRTTKRGNGSDVLVSRMKALGGDGSIQSSPGQGTTLFGWFPLNHQY